ncbi:MAG: endopeptidase La [Sphingomonadaceae bacterium]
MAESGQELEAESREELLRIIPEVLPIQPLRGTVAYPFAAIPLQISQERSVRLMEDVARGNRLVVLVAQRRAEVETAGPSELYGMGTVARVLQLVRHPQGGMTVAVQGLERALILEYTSEHPYLVGKIELRPEVEERTPEVEALRRNLLGLFQRMVALSNYLPSELSGAVATIEDPREFAYVVASNVRGEVALNQAILEVDSVREKLKMLTDHLEREIAVMEIGESIRAQAQERISRSQREYILREQLRAIQRELGEEEEGPDREIAQLRKRLDEAGLPPEARQEADRELSRLEQLPAVSPEHGIIVNYLDWLSSLPWNKVTGGKIDVPHARQVLDEDHYDLDQIKERILEYLAVRKLKEERMGETPGEEGLMREPILCFVGPPGVGKTSLGQSIARSMGRKFIRISLGGVRDEAEIRGHRRTYVGAMPGRIIQGIRRVGTADPVFMLDEVDKLAVGYQGDPAAALLEVLDPAQNYSFTDNFLGVPFDLSRVMFVTTANNLDTIPGPLLDRMEVLELAGYTEEEKLHIARRYLVPKQLRAHGLAPEEVSFDDEALRVVIRDYTREAGVRNLERQIATVCRKAARQLAEGARGPIRVTAESIHDFLGRPRFFAQVAERIDRPGVATGLAWTPTGGEIIFVEATMMQGRNNRLILTGMLGDVMRESAQAALSYVRSNAHSLGIDPVIFEDKDIHIHVPAGAIPKDGPSAGITMAVALASLVTGRAVRHDVAMTGEVTLRGKLLPVGGIKEKVLAARRAGIRTVLLPRRNEPALEEVPEELRNEMRFVLVDTIEQALAEALTPTATGAQLRAA